jgi:hypothetical protein
LIFTENIEAGSIVQITEEEVIEATYPMHCNSRGLTSVVRVAAAGRQKAEAE